MGDNVLSNYRMAGGYLEQVPLRSSVEVRISVSLSWQRASSAMPCVHSNVGQAAARMLQCRSYMRFPN